MSQPNLDQLIRQLENYLECWKQFNHYLNLARTKKFTEEDENQFLELKSLLTQELELILAAIESGTPNKDDIHSVVSSAPSIRFLSELSEASLRNLENQWHRIFISWQSILGQLKVRKRQGASRFSLSRWFGQETG
ncbi:MAG: hypothetical protein M1608_06810 [Candidatus Omnitrophica bacterium]|nr:hypothetical protein [Candidatus Omnitrophota bacterium]